MERVIEGRLNKQIASELGTSERTIKIHRGNLMRKMGAESLPDLIVLDLNLPKVTGDQVLLLIKADPELRSIPVLILSSSSSREDIRRCYDNQASCYIVKPAELGDYMRLVQAWGNFWMSQATLPLRGPVLQASF